jgi:hypothetical protein
MPFKQTIKNYIKKGGREGREKEGKVQDFVLSSLSHCTLSHAALSGFTCNDICIIVSAH